MMATTSVGGPPVLIYLLSGNDPPQVNRANIVTYYFLTQFLLIVIVMATGVAGWEALARAVVLFPMMVRGVAGRPAVPWPGQRALYRNAALAILFATGLFGLFRNWIAGMSQYLSRAARPAAGCGCGPTINTPARSSSPRASAPRRSPVTSPGDINCFRVGTAF